MLIEKPKKVSIAEEKAHFSFIRTLPCVYCGDPKTEVCHIRKGTDGGTGKKPSPWFVHPLCHHCHSRSHQIGEFSFWHGDEGLRLARQLARDLWGCDKDREAGYDLIRHARREIWQ